MARLLLAGALACLALSCPLAALGQELAPISRRLPPPGIDVPEGMRTSLQASLDEGRAKLDQVQDHALAADVEVFLKAVDYALRHGEFYNTKDFKTAEQLLQSAHQRLDELLAGKPSWPGQRGLLVRGYRSRIDGSPQPYGLVIPDDLDLEKPAPLYIWLHGRGDKTTDLHFIAQRQTQRGQIAPSGAIVLHPFGRHCVGFKSAGEIDVLEAIEHAKSQYPIDPDRILLMGFSMGGAGAWHLGAHYADHWAAMSAGAGFVETARYTRLREENYPPRYEQALWKVYDVPNYVRNLFNLPVVAYSGELDKQIQAAQVMEEAFAGEGRKLTHLIGPGMGHKYHPDTLAEIMQAMDQAAQAGRPKLPAQVSLQTPTLRYNRMHWVEALGLERHWQDSRIDAAIGEDGEIEVATKNITALRLSPWRARSAPQATIRIDGQTVQVDSPREVVLAKRDGRWSVQPTSQESGLAKRPGLQGPIDDAFLEPFLVVTPSGRCQSDAVQRWMEFELAHLKDRWRAVFRGELPVKQDRDVTDDDIESRHLVLWGDPAANVVLKKIADRLPLVWRQNSLEFSGIRRDGASHVPLMIYPNPDNPRKYIVLNSGPTFREAHDRTNSLQNPKLPDWAIVDIRTPPSDEASGRVAAAGFFDERWQLLSSRRTVGAYDNSP